MNVAVPRGEIELARAGNGLSHILIVATLAFLIIGAPVMMMAPHAAAQGCAMCYQNAASSGGQGRTALRHGILILLLPALSLFVGIFFLIYRRRNPA
ncbi:MAG: hypothetical protein WA581_20840 [Candidatus Acidiferrales bacterium]